MWRNELYVAFRKGYCFDTALDRCSVPLDCVEEANIIWGNARASEQFEEFPG